MLFRHRHLLQVGVGLFDLAAVAWVVLLTQTLRPVRAWEDLAHLLAHPDFLQVAAVGSLSAVLWWILAVRCRLYRSRRTDNFGSELILIAEIWIVVTAVAHACATAAFGAAPVRVDATFVAGLLVIGSQRVVLRIVLASLRAQGRNTRNLIFIGWGRAAESLEAMFRTHPEYGIRCRGIVAMPGEALPGDLPLPVLGRSDRLEVILGEEQPQAVLLAPPQTVSLEHVARAFEVCDAAGLPCSFASPLFGSHLRPKVEDFAGVPAISFVPAQSGEMQAAGKRTFDLALACISLLLMSPVLLALAIGIKLQDRGPILFRQRRVGRFAQEFYCLKFRTMVPEADRLKAELAAQNEEDGPAFKIKNDPRITPLGRILRRYSLDELPQLWNVLVGDMSFVGPRPPTPDEVKQYEWAWRRRLSVRPGLTCVWQIWGRNRVPFRRWMEMDLLYIDNWSLWKDIKLILRTMVVVARGTGT